MIIRKKEETFSHWFRIFIEDFVNDFVTECDYTEFFNEPETFIVIKDRDDEVTNDLNSIILYDDYITSERTLNSCDNEYIFEVKKVNVRVRFSGKDESKEEYEIARELTSSLKHTLNGVSLYQYNMPQIVAMTDDRLIQYDLDEVPIYDVTFKVIFKFKRDN